MFVTSLLTISTFTLKICIVLIFNFSFNTDEHHAVLFDTQNARVIYYGPTVVHCTVMCRTNEITRRHEKKGKRYEGKTGTDPLIWIEMHEK